MLLVQMTRNAQNDITLWMWGIDSETGAAHVEDIFQSSQMTTQEMVDILRAHYTFDLVKVPEGTKGAIPVGNHWAIPTTDKTIVETLIAHSEVQ